MNDASSALLAIVEVDELNAVACRAPGCNHKVFRAVHVVRADGQVTVLGSSCFKKLYGASDIGKSKPRFTTGTARKLTDEERALLRENAEELIRRFEAELPQRAAVPLETRPTSVRSKRRRSLFTDPLAGVDPKVIAEAKNKVALRYGCDPNQPGWKGLIIAEVHLLLKRNAA